MPYAIVVGSRPQPRGCLQGLQPSRHPHVHLNPPVLHCMATIFSVTPAQLKQKRRAVGGRSGGGRACAGRAAAGRGGGRSAAGAAAGARAAAVAGGRRPERRWARVRRASGGRRGGGRSAPRLCHMSTAFPHPVPRGPDGATGWGKAVLKWHNRGWF
jgi:hypothetical protein